MIFRAGTFSLEELVVVMKDNVIWHRSSSELFAFSVVVTQLDSDSP